MIFKGYTLSGMDRDSMPDFFIQKRGHLLSPRYTINSPQKSWKKVKQMSHNDSILNIIGIKDKNIKIISVEEAEHNDDYVK